MYIEYYIEEWGGTPENYKSFCSANFCDLTKTVECLCHARFSDEWGDKAPHYIHVRWHDEQEWTKYSVFAQQIMDFKVAPVRRKKQ